MPKALYKESPARARARRRYTSIGQEDDSGLFSDLLNLISPPDDQGGGGEAPAPPTPAPDYRPEPERTPSDTSYIDVADSKGRVTATQLRLRAQPSTSATTVTTMPQNTVVNIGRSSTEGWLYVEWGNFKGYASSQYIEPVSDNYVPSPAPPPRPAPAPPRPAPGPSPAPPASGGVGILEKLFVTAVVLTVVGVPTYMLLKRKHRYA